MKQSRIEKITQITEHFADVLCSGAPAMSDEQVQEIINLFGETAVFFRSTGIEDTMAAVRARLGIDEEADQ